MIRTKGLMTIDELRAHLGGSFGVVTNAIRERVRDEMPGYLWIITDLDSRRHRYVVCERCDTHHTEVKHGRRWANAYHQGERMACPYCGGTVTVKYMGRGYVNLYDRMNVIWYQKIAVDPNAVVAIAAHCFRDFDGTSDRPWQSEAVIDLRSISVIVYGEGSYRYKKDVARWELVGGRHRQWQPAEVRWIPARRFGRLTFGNTGAGTFVHSNPPGTLLMVETLEAAIAGTPFERAWSDRYLTETLEEDGTRALTMIAKYPCVEYMTKLGMLDFVPAKLNDDLPTGLVNWRGRTITRVLGLDRQRLGELKHAGVIVTPALLALYRWMDAGGYHLTATAAHNVTVLAMRYTTVERMDLTMTKLLRHHDPTRRQKALKYIARQCEKNGDTRLHLGDFLDYWRLCVRFEENMNQDAVAFPTNIVEAEARMSRREQREREAQSKDDRERQDKLIARNYKLLEREYGFSFGGLTLRPARSGAEVRAEGAALHHCVGGYVQKYAEGKTVICVLRRDIEPDTPWRTVEISATGRLIQDRGYHNDTSFGIPLTPSYKAMLDLFWTAWKEREGRKSA